VSVTEIVIFSRPY